MRDGRPHAILLQTNSPVALLYAGDRMWPAVPHGSRIRAEALPPGPIVRGTAVIAGHDGVPDLYSVLAGRVFRRRALEAELRAARYAVEPDASTGYWLLKPTGKSA